MTPLHRLSNATMIFGANVALVGAALAADAGKKIGNLDQAFQQGYVFAGYGAFNPEPKPAGSAMQGRQGSVFLKKGNELALCEFNIVASKAPGAQPTSVCYEVK